MDEIQSLTLRIRDLSQSVDFWNGLMLWGLALAAIAAVFVVIATRIVVSKTGKLSEAQGLLGAAKDRQLASDLRAKDIEIGSLKIKAGNADARVAGLEKDASDAKSAQQQVQIELAKQQERAATAEKDLLALQDKVKPRHLSEAEKQLLIEKLRGIPPIALVISWPMSSEDGAGYGEDFAEVFRQLGWTVTPDDMMAAMYSAPFTGVLIGIKRNPAPLQAIAVIKALNEVGIGGSGTLDAGLPENSIAIKIGTKQ